jgi:uncharacterized OB-fold protein
MANTPATFPPLPRPNPMTQFFWDGCKARRLMILRCRPCGHFVHYPRPICNKCLSTELAPQEVSGRASLYAYTLTMQAFHPYYVDKLPYMLAVVELEEQPGLRITTNIVDVEEAALKTGMPVRLVWREIAPDLVLPMFTKADA